MSKNKGKEKTPPPAGQPLDFDTFLARTSKTLIKNFDTVITRYSDPVLERKYESEVWLIREFVPGKYLIRDPEPFREVIDQFHASSQKNNTLESDEHRSNKRHKGNKTQKVQQPSHAPVNLSVYLQPSKYGPPTHIVDFLKGEQFTELLKAVNISRSDHKQTPKPSPRELAIVLKPWQDMGRVLISKFFNNLFGGGFLADETDSASLVGGYGQKGCRGVSGRVRSGNPSKILYNTMV